MPDDTWACNKWPYEVTLLGDTWACIKWLCEVTLEQSEHVTSDYAKWHLSMYQVTMCQVTPEHVTSDHVRWPGLLSHWLWWWPGLLSHWLLWWPGLLSYWLWKIASFDILTCISGTTCPIVMKFEYVDPLYVRNHWSKFHNNWTSGFKDIEGLHIW